MNKLIAIKGYIVKRKDNVIIYTMMFLVGFFVCLSFVGIISYAQEQPGEPIFSENNDAVKESFVSNLLNIDSEDKPSPFDWISESQIHVYNDRIYIDLKQAEWATFTDTNSMDPVIDAGANAIEIRPKNEQDIHVGDIVSYESKYADGVLIHRVVETGYDDEGWYMKVKGDNNPNEDPGRIRFDQIQRVVVAIIY